MNIDHWSASRDSWYTTIFLPFLLCCGLFLYDLEDYDFWWHLQIGRDILSHHVWPSPDRYSFTTNETWVVHSWLSDCAFYLYHEMASPFWGASEYEDLRILRILLLTLYGVGVYSFTRRYSHQATLNYGITFICCFSCWEYPIRPILLNPLISLVFYRFLFKKEISRWDWIVYPLLTIVWVNSQGAYSIFLAVLFITCFLHGCTSFGRTNSLYTKKWLYLSMVCLLTSMVNPHPFALLYRIIMAPTYLTADWFSLFWWITNIPLYGIPMAVLHVVAILFWCGSLRFLRRDDRYFQSGRFILALLSILLVLFVYRLGWLSSFLYLDAVYNVRHYLPKNEKPNWLILLLLYSILLLSQSTKAKITIFELPQKTVEQLLSIGSKGNLFCPWTWSGYVTWKTNTSWQTFLDTRIEPFPPEIILIHDNIKLNPIRNFRQLVKTHTDFILYPIDDSLKNWDQLYQNGLIEYIYIDKQCFLAKIVEHETEENPVAIPGKN